MTRTPQPRTSSSSSMTPRPQSGVSSGRAVRSARTSTLLYSVPEAASSRDNTSTSDSRGTSKKQKRVSQLNTHLEHLFGSPQMGRSQKDSIEMLEGTYGGLAWDPEELARLSLSSRDFREQSPATSSSRGGPASPRIPSSPRMPSSPRIPSSPSVAPGQGTRRSHHFQQQPNSPLRKTFAC